jgi:hypothetical protein
LKPYDHKEILERKLAGMFPDEAIRSQAREILDAYGEESSEEGANRVRLAILKLSKPSLESVREYTQCARVDFRDVLAWAEYPNQIKNPPLKDEEKRKALIEQDRKQYEKWLLE